MVVSAGNNGGDPHDARGRLRGHQLAGQRAVRDHRRRVRHGQHRPRDDDTIPWYSSRGPTWYDAFQKPDLVAPGHRMVSDIDRTGTLYRTYPQYIVAADRKSEGRELFPVERHEHVRGDVTGAAALVIRREPDPFGQALPPNAIKASCEYTALPLADYDLLTQGAGALNVMGALRSRNARPAGRGRGLVAADRVSADHHHRGARPDVGQRVVWGDQRSWATRSTRTGRRGRSASSGATASCGATGSCGDNGTVWSGRLTRGLGQSCRLGYGLIGYVDGDRVVWGDRRSPSSKPAVWCGATWRTRRLAR